MENVLLVPPTLFCTAMVKLKVPAFVGIPLMTPVPEFKVRPSGSEPELRVQVIGVAPLAESVN